MANTIADFWALVEKLPNGCWIYRGEVLKTGYGRFWFKGKRVLAHRFAYETEFGLIPEGSVPDHTCHSRDLLCPGGWTCPHRRCVNYDHVEIVSPLENARRQHSFHARKTHCRNGHPYDGVNTRIVAGERRCVVCIKEMPITGITRI